VALKILLADDSMIAQNMGRKILTDAGYEVIPVSNGAAAVKRLPDVNPDIVVLDVYMPGYTGLEVCEKIKNLPATAHIPVLLTVGKLEPFRPEDGMKVKADGVIVKPFEATDLVAVVAKLAERIPLMAAPKLSPVEPLPQVQTGQEMEEAAPPAPVHVPAEFAGAPALGDDFLSELVIEAPPVSEAPAALNVIEVFPTPVSDVPTTGVELPVDLPIEIDFLMDTPEETSSLVVEPEPESVPSAEIQAAVAGFDFLTMHVPAGVPAAEQSTPQPASTVPEQALVAEDSEAELPPIEIYLEPVGAAQESFAEAVEPVPPPVDPSPLQGLEPTLMEASPETEIAPAPGLMSDYNESPVQILNEAVAAPPEVSAEEPPEFAIFNAVLAADSETRMEDNLAATLEAYDAAAKIAEPRPEPPSAMEPTAASVESAPAYSDAAVPARITDTEIPASPMATMATTDGIGLALEAMLLGAIEEPETEEMAAVPEAIEPAIEIIMQFSGAEPEVPPAAVEIPIEFESQTEVQPVEDKPVEDQLVEEQPVEIALESILETEPAEEPLPAPAEPILLWAASPPSPDLMACLSSEVDSDVAEQIVDSVLDRIRPELVEEVRRLLGAR
jgi:CheY-like chemotaxis protein